MREPADESLVRQNLEGQGYSIVARSRPTGPDILATRDGRVLLVEVKGDRPGHQSSPATVHVDTLTLIGQIVLRRSRREADEFAVAIRPVHRRLVEQAMATLRELSIRVLLVEDTGIHELRA